VSVTDYTDLLPESVLDLIDIIGPRATDIIVQRRGGTPIKIPVKARPTHWLHDAIGEQALTDLVKIYAGCEIYIPRCHAALKALRRQQIVDGKAAGISTVDLALMHGMSDRSVRDILASHRAEQAENQLDLFDNAGAQPPERLTND